MPLSWPLIKRKIGPNRWYGIRIRAAFESEARWYDLNAYGGRMFRRWGLVVTLVGLAGLTLPPSLWPAYAVGSTGVMLGGLVVVLLAIYRYARSSKKP
ncbi:MAG TPA: SdpI family protein [Desulfobaccales bacterium]